MALHQALALVAYDGVALARGPLEPGAVPDLDVPPPVRDEAALLERARSEGDARALGSEHLGHELVGQHELVPVDGIVAEQEPPGEPGADVMGGIARGRLA